MIDWVNFSVFFNAWSFGSHESVLPKREETTSFWNVVPSLLEKCIVHQLGLTGPMVCGGRDLQVLVQLIAEPLAWHGLVLQSYIRSLLPCGKKKKKSGVAADNSTSLLSETIRASVSSLYSMVETLAKRIREEVDKIGNEGGSELLSSLVRGPNEGPGQVFQAPKDFISTADESELGDRIFQAIKCWSPEDISRKTVKSQQNMMLDFLQICESKLKLLKSLKQQL